MGNYFKSALKVFFSYSMSVILFAVLFLAFYSFAKNQLSTFLPIYSFGFFVIMFLMMYSDLKELAIREKKRHDNSKSYPLKGLVLGFIGFSPFILLELICAFLVFKDGTYNQIKHIALNTLLSPLYWIFKFGNESAPAYAISTLTVPLTAMLGYATGYYGFEPGVFFKKLSGKAK